MSKFGTAKKMAWICRRYLFLSLFLTVALAVAPARAAPIHTDSEGLVAGDVKVPIQGGEIAAYRAFPAKGGPFPTLLVAVTSPPCICRSCLQMVRPNPVPPYLRELSLIHI